MLFLYILVTIEGVPPSMRSVLVRAVKLLRDRRGATVVEYGFILALIVLAIMAALVELGSTTSSMWNNVSQKVQATN